MRIEAGRPVLAVVAFVLFLPVVAFAQQGTIAGVVRDSSEAVMPGVRVEVTSPPLIERVRFTISDGAASASRSTAPCTPPTVGTGCFVASGFTVTQTTYQVNLLDFGDMYTDGVSLLDLKLAKVLRFGRTRLNAGVDIYNLFNSSAVTAANTTYSLTGTNNWGLPTTLVNPRFCRVSVQYEF
jgi:hypothetical protein